MEVVRTRYWLGGHVGGEERRDQYEQGIAVARRASLMERDSPEGHFWMAANMGALAESFGIRAGLRYRSPIRERLEIVLGLDPAFQPGSADRALDRWYFKVPGLFGGSDDRAIKHLERSLTYNPDSTATLFFLAETLLEIDRAEEPKARLEHVLAAPPDPEWAPEIGSSRPRRRCCSRRSSPEHSRAVGSRSSGARQARDAPVASIFAPS